MTTNFTLVDLYTTAFLRVILKCNDEFQHYYKSTCEMLDVLSAHDAVEVLGTVLFVILRYSITTITIQFRQVITKIVRKQTYLNAIDF